jgi:tRNA (guanosine-2'-O-)-methyltransferase
MSPNSLTPDDRALLAHLSEFLTPRRRERFAEVLRRRTRYLSVVLADVYQQHNASAVLRTCDAFGIQDIHVVEVEHEFDANTEIALGSDQWLTLHRHAGAEGLQNCLNELRAQGVQIAATVLHAESRPVGELDLARPTALLFGTEKDGLPPAAIELADVLVHLPMYGFVESFNVSVAVALCLQQLVPRLHASALPWRLSPEEEEQLIFRWTRHSVPGAEAIERRFQSQRTPGV